MMNSTDFFDLLNSLLQKNEPDADLTLVAGKHLCIKPDVKRSFPVRDIENVEETSDAYTISCSFMGLYGVDSPLPVYFNDRCLQQTSAGAALRALLDVFNHRSYVLYFLAWQAFQPESNACYGDSDYRNLIKHIVPERSGVLNSFGFSKNFVKRFWKQAFPGLPLFRIEVLPAWEALQQHVYLGCGLKLGENSVLGERVIIQSGLLRLKTEALSIERAQMLLPNGALFHQVNLLKAYAKNSGMQIKVLPQVCRQGEPLARLGSSQLALGRTSWLGSERVEAFYL